MTLTSVQILTVLSVPTLLVRAYYDHPTTKSYDLQVPGSSPIRIIEADPDWQQHTTNRIPYYSTTAADAYEPSTTLETRTSLNGPILPAEDYPEDTVSKNGTEALKRFLKKFADNLKRHQFTTTGKPAQDFHQRFDEVKLIEKPRDGTSLYSLEKPSSASGERDVEKDEVSKSWDLVSMQKQNSPYDQKQGWVSLEAVPWSVSKVSKWQSNQRPGANDKVWEEDRPEHFGKPRPDYPIKRPSVVYNPGELRQLQNLQLFTISSQIGKRTSFYKIRTGWRCFLMATMVTVPDTEKPTFWTVLEKRTGNFVQFSKYNIRKKRPRQQISKLLINFVSNSTKI